MPPTPRDRAATPEGSEAYRIDQPRWSGWIIPFVVICAIGSARAFVQVSTGGHGVLPLVPLIAPIAALVALARQPTRTRLAFVNEPLFVLAVLPYLVLTLILPILGVMVNGYPERTLLSITDATTAASFLVLGGAVGAGTERAWARWMTIAIAVTLVYSVGQTIYWSRGPAWELFTPFAQWDLRLAALQAQLGSLGRSTGLFTNPNDLGLWAAVACVLAWTVVPPGRRGLVAALAVVTLLLSQSRGAAVGLAAAALAGVFIALLRGDLRPRALLQAVGVLAIVGGLAVVAGMVIATPSVLVSRFGPLLTVLAEGPQGDPNLASRLNLWGGVIALNSTYPFGTLGSPELVLGAAVDSQWFRAFAQGSILYLASLALLLAAPLGMLRSRTGFALGLVVVVMAVVGLTQMPLGSAVSILFWALLGSVLQANALERRPKDRRQARRWHLPGPTTPPV